MHGNVWNGAGTGTDRMLHNQRQIHVVRRNPRQQRVAVVRGGSFGIRPCACAPRSGPSSTPRTGSGSAGFGVCASCPSALSDLLSLIFVHKSAKTTARITHTASFHIKRWRSRNTLGLIEAEQLLPRHAAFRVRGRILAPSHAK